MLLQTHQAIVLTRMAIGLRVNKDIKLGGGIYGGGKKVLAPACAWFDGLFSHWYVVFINLFKG